MYEISNLGRVKTWYYKKEKILKLWKKNCWHSIIGLCNDWARKWYSVSRLVALHFIPNPNNLPCACHKKEELDENWRLYNWVDNLWWGTYSDNNKDRYNKWRANNPFQINHPRPNLWKFWKNNPLSKKVNQYTKEWEFIKSWYCIKDVKRELLINSSSISKCCKWKVYTAWWFIWKYELDS